MKKTILLFLLCNICASSQTEALFSILDMYYLFPKPAKKYLIHAYLIKGDSLHDTGSILTDLYHGNEYIKIGDTKILPSETDSLKINSILGLPYKGTWIWRAKKGKINLFVYHPNKNISNYKFIQKEGNLVPYSTKTLELFVSDYPESKKLVNNFRLERTTSVSMFFGGIVLMGSSFFVNPKYKAIPIAAGALSISISAVIFIKSNDNCKKAINIYNNR